jgi:plastocyanin
MRHRRFIGFGSLLLVLLAAAVVGAGLLPAGAAGATVKRVTIKNMTFTPQTITVKAGTKVTWKNADGVAHDVTSADSMKTTAKVTGLFASAQLSNGQRFSFTFKKKGTFYYECTIHASMASMHGKVIVK